MNKGKTITQGNKDLKMRNTVIIILLTWNTIQTA